MTASLRKGETPNPDVRAVDGGRDRPVTLVRSMVALAVCAYSYYSNMRLVAVSLSIMRQSRAQ
jgi:hypothetical protein